MKDRDNQQWQGQGRELSHVVRRTITRPIGRLCILRSCDAVRSVPSCSWESRWAAPNRLTTPRASLPSVKPRTRCSGRMGGPSPIRPGEIDKFVPLSYFPIEESYAVPAQLEPAPERIAVTMPTSTGTMRGRRAGGNAQVQPEGAAAQIDRVRREGPTPTVRAVLGFDQRHRDLPGRPLHDPRSDPERHLHRRLQCRLHPGTAITTPSTECPLPPRENRLTVPIRAGERMRRADSTIDR